MRYTCTIRIAGLNGNGVYGEFVGAETVQAVAATTAVRIARDRVVSAARDNGLFPGAQVSSYHRTDASPGRRTYKSEGRV